MILETYDEAKDRLKKLEKQEYAFTTDYDVEPEKKVAEIVKKHKQIKLAVSETTKNALKNLPDLPSEITEDRSLSGIKRGHGCNSPVNRKQKMKKKFNEKQSSKFSSKQH